MKVTLYIDVDKFLRYNYNKYLTFTTSVTVLCFSRSNSPATEIIAGVLFVLVMVNTASQKNKIYNVRF